MPIKTVFISSVIRGFAAERESAKAAVKSLDLRPVMAEHFPAYSTAPRTACLEEVRTSDVYVGLLGERYGYVSNSGLSPTEEEFNEARRQGKPTFVFVIRGDHQTEQQAFIERISSYEGGLQLKFLDDASHVGPEVTKALLRLIGDRSDGRLGVTRAQSVLERRLGELPRSDSDASIGAALIPVRQMNPYLSLVDLQSGALQDMLKQAALFGQTAVFTPAHGTACSEAPDHMEFSQTGPRGRCGSVLRFYEDGSLTWWSTLQNEDGEFGGLSLVKTNVINEESVAGLVTAFLRYAEAFYSALPDTDMISSVYFWSALFGIGYRRFGRLVPLPTGAGMSLGGGQLADPLHVSPSPIELARARLQDAATIGEQIKALYARKFRVAGAYYPTP